MSRFQKIFLASAFVVIGFGVAKFLGQPVLPKQPVRPYFLSQLTQTDTSAPAIAGTNSSIRLLPKPSVPQFGVPAANSHAEVSELPRLAGTLAPVGDQTNREPRNLNLNSDPIAPASLGTSSNSFARLRDEAPRAIGVDPQSPATIRRLPSGDSDVPNIAPLNAGDTKVTSSDWPEPPLLRVGHTAGSPPDVTAVPASYVAPAIASVDTQSAPSSWPASELQQNSQQRIHIVSDGDSLERLASRYLSDPHRGREIYELNRAILMSPDILPIGAELRIPERETVSINNLQGPPPSSALIRPSDNVIVDGRSVVNAAAASSEPIIPRAQLAPPMMVQ